MNWRKNLAAAYEARRSADRVDRRADPQGADQFAVSFERWPSTDDFIEEGKTALYKAASRSGGMRKWRSEIESRMSRAQTSSGHREEDGKV
jgi:hypothetical protein